MNIHDSRKRKQKVYTGNLSNVISFPYVFEEREIVTNVKNEGYERRVYLLEDQLCKVSESNLLLENIVLSTYRKS